MNHNKALVVILSFLQLFKFLSLAVASSLLETPQELYCHCSGYHRCFVPVCQHQQLKRDYTRAAAAPRNLQEFTQQDHILLLLHNSHNCLDISTVKRNRFCPRPTSSSTFNIAGCQFCVYVYSFIILPSTAAAHYYSALVNVLVKLKVREVVER